MMMGLLHPNHGPGKGPAAQGAGRWRRSRIVPRVSLPLNIYTVTYVRVPFESVRACWCAHVRALW